MKTYKTIQVPAREQKTVDEKFCDLCKCKIYPWSGGIDEAEVSYEREFDDENGQDLSKGKRTVVDLCGYCFNGKLIPWLESQGAQPTIEEWTY
jgi:hypothetical protein